MDDLISRRAVIDVIKAISNLDEKAKGGIIATLSLLDSVQPEIIHCKDCIYGAKDENGFWYCTDTGYATGDAETGMGYCSYAERRNDE